jgi:hypothetical protein
MLTGQTRSRQAIATTCCYLVGWYLSIAAVHSVTAAATTCLAPHRYGIASRRGPSSRPEIVRAQVCQIPTPVETTEVSRKDDVLCNSSKAKQIGTVVLLLPSRNAGTMQSKFGAASPVSKAPPSILEAAQHIAQKIHWWSDAAIHASVVTIPSPTVRQNVFSSLYETDLVLASQ